MYEALLAQWNDVPHAERVTGTQALIEAYQVFARAVGRQAWPLTTQVELAALLRQDTTIIADLRAWAASGLKQTNPLFVAFRHAQHGMEATLCVNLSGLPGVSGRND